MKPIPPAMQDDQRPGHYMEPEHALAKYASQHYKVGKSDSMPPSERALALYEKHTAASPLLPFPEAKLPNAVAEINDSAITLDVLREHFRRLQYTRLRVLEGHRKATETRKKNKAAREEATEAATAKIAKQKEEVAAKANLQKGRRKRKAIASSSSSDDDEKFTGSQAGEGARRDEEEEDDDDNDDEEEEEKEEERHLEDDEQKSASGSADQMDCSDEDIGDVACDKCKLQNRAATMLLCDMPACERAFHMHCLNPQLFNVPRDDWHCPVCAGSLRDEDECTPQKEGSAAGRDRRQTSPGHKLARTSTYERNGWTAPEGTKRNRGAPRSISKQL